MITMAVITTVKSKSVVMASFRELRAVTMVSIITTSTLALAARIVSSPAAVTGSQIPARGVTMDSTIPTPSSMLAAQAVKSPLVEMVFKTVVRAVI